MGRPHIPVRWPAFSFPSAFAQAAVLLRWLAALLFLASIQPALAQRAAVSNSVSSTGMGANDARHLLARTGFGPTVAEVETVARLNRAEAIDRLLATALVEARTPPPAWSGEPVVTLRQVRDAGPEQRRAFLQQEMRRGFELRAWWIDEMLATPSPLTERMTLFWHNHFTSSQQKVRYTQLMYRQNALLRRHALGNFGELLHAASKDPAMIIYLDSATNRKGRPNENFAREVMELFTLGEGQYAEADIREAARAFTGWSIDPDTAAFRWRPLLHDSGTKTVLGRRGDFDGDAVLDILLEQPRTARYLVEKLWREFVSPQPDAAEVDRIAGAFRGSRYEIRAALRALLLSPAFWAPEHRAALIKSPAEFVVGTLRQFDVPVADATPFALVMAGLGQNLFSPPNVKGWPGGEAWINSGTLLARKEFVARLFRADEMRGPAAPMPEERSAMRVRDEVADRGKEVASVAAAGPLLGREMRERLRRAAEETRFDSAGWFARLKGGSGQVIETDIERFVLAASPANPLPAGVSGRERLRLLALDPAYQLK